MESVQMPDGSFDLAVWLPDAGPAGTVGAHERPPGSGARHAAMDRLIYARSAGGEPVAECELSPAEAGLLPALAEEATRAGAARLWVHCAADLTPFGFTACEGYRRLLADPAPAGDPLPVLDPATAADLLSRAFIGQWGHKQPDPEWVTSGEAVYVGLPQAGSWAGLCRAGPAGRYVDGPGFLPGQRTPDGVRALVRGACALLTPGPVTVDTWGDPAGPYLDIGFEIAEEVPGWERILR